MMKIENEPLNKIYNHLLQLVINPVELEALFVELLDSEDYLDFSFEQVSSVICLLPDKFRDKHKTKILRNENFFEACVTERRLFNKYVNGENINKFILLLKIGRIQIDPAILLDRLFCDENQISTAWIFTNWGMIEPLCNQILEPQFRPDSLLVRKAFAKLMSDPHEPAAPYVWLAKSILKIKRPQSYFSHLIHLKPFRDLNKKLSACGEIELYKKLCECILSKENAA
jgi:hypothetical protein